MFNFCQRRRHLRNLTPSVLLPRALVTVAVCYLCYVITVPRQDVIFLSDEESSDKRGYNDEKTERKKQLDPDEIWLRKHPDDYYRKGLGVHNNLAHKVRYVHQNNIKPFAMPSNVLQKWADEERWDMSHRFDDARKFALDTGTATGVSTTEDPFGGEFKYAGYFSDHMLLQRAPYRVMIWGYAPASTVGEKVGIEISNKLKEYVTVVKQDGDQITWEVVIDAYYTSGPHDISATLRSHVIWLRGVMFGDVWLCAGSTNMAIPNKHIHTAENAWRNSNVRTYVMRTSPPNTWNIPSKGSLSEFSAACWEFGLRLERTTGHPVGLIQLTAPGSEIAAWLPPDNTKNCTDTVSSKNYDSKHKSSVFNSMISPLLKMTVYGVLWYHGEDEETTAPIYSCHLQAIRSSWTQRWRSGLSQEEHRQTPWAIVQIGATRGKTTADLRWAQSAGYGYLPNSAMPNAYLVVTVDITHILDNNTIILDADILSKRLVFGAIAVAYSSENSSKENAQGPRPHDINVSDDRIAITYSLGHNNSSIELKSKYGFEVCCDAEKVIEPDSCTWQSTEIVNHTAKDIDILNPCKDNILHAVRYLWKESPCDFLYCPIYDKSTGLPASIWMHSFK